MSLAPVLPGDKAAAGRWGPQPDVSVEDPVLGTQQMALPPHPGELGTQLLPVVTSLGTQPPGHPLQGTPGPAAAAETSGVLPPPQSGVSRPAPCSFWGRKSSRKGGDLLILMLDASCTPAHRRVCDSFPCFFFQVLCEAFLGHAPVCALGPASPEWMEMCMGRGRNSCGSGEASREVLGEAEGKQSCPLPCEHKEQARDPICWR